MYRLLCVLLGYVFGLFETGYFYGKIRHVDIRTLGSGNAGTTNALRTLGLKAGILTFAGDFLKCVLAVMMSRWLFKGEEPDVLAMYTGLGVVLGHNYPFYMNFQGGKGIAVGSGLIMTCMEMPYPLFCYGTFVLAVILTKYVSVGSLSMMAVFFIEMVYLVMSGKLTKGEFEGYEMLGIALFLLLLACFRHRSNIGRLFAGTENKISIGKGRKE